MSGRVASCVGKAAGAQHLRCDRFSRPLAGKAWWWRPAGMCFFWYLPLKSLATKACVKRAKRKRFLFRKRSLKLQTHCLAHSLSKQSLPYVSDLSFVSSLVNYLAVFYS